MTTSFAKPKQRIVSLVPSVTSILLSIGVTRELVGVSKWCKHVAKIGKRPQVGDCWKLDVSEVMRLRPTLVIGSVPFAPETVAQILEQPVTFLALNPRSLADIESDVHTLGRVTSRPREAARLARKMRRTFAHAGAQAAELPNGDKPRVYCEVWSNPRISSPPWVAEMVRLAGGIPVLSPGARVSDKQIAQAKPDVIILAWAATGDRAKTEPTLRNPLWQTVPAVKRRQVFVIRDELLNTPGPPLIEGLAALSRVIHSCSSHADSE